MQKNDWNCRIKGSYLKEKNFIIQLYIRVNQNYMLFVGMCSRIIIFLKIGQKLLRLISILFQSCRLLKST